MTDPVKYTTELIFISVHRLPSRPYVKLWFCRVRFAWIVCPFQESVFCFVARVVGSDGHGRHGSAFLIFILIIIIVVVVVRLASIRNEFVDAC